MSTPTYRWTCHKCGQGNSPGIPVCVYCGFPAVASAGEIARAKGEPDPMGKGYKALLRFFECLALLLFWWT